jgi:putative addiction module component (TIGR02574 family)
MSQRTKVLAEQARQLPPADRIDLVDEILASLDESDARMDRLWTKEAEERLAAYRRGEIRAIPLDEMLARYRTR